MHVGHALENLLHVGSHLGPRDVSLVLLVLLNDFFEVGPAELEDKVLGSLALLIFGIVDVEELDDVLAPSKAVQHFVLSTDIFTGLGCPLDGYCLLV